MALDRDVRLSERQLYYGARAVSDRERVLEGRLQRSSYDGKPGMKSRVLEELAELRELARILEHNRRAIAREFADRIASSSGAI